jgi:aspartate kinase
MAIVVQKFGGSSLADPDRVRHCARRVTAARQAGADVIVVVSAMGDTTDVLIDLAQQITSTPSKREMDMLLATGEQVSIALLTMALESLGVDAVSMTGHQLGIVTDQIHTKARIKAIQTEALRDQFARGRVVVAAGFQGVSVDGQITTLGRGGSDTTAVALAAALDVNQEGACEIYTDVAGVYTADPRIVPTARLLDRISHEEMLELASAGAGVVHNRAVIFGRKYGVAIHVRSSIEPGPGTMITRENKDMEEVSVIGCALTPDLGRVSVRGVPNEPGIQAVIFSHIADASVLIDDIMQTEDKSSATANISFTVDARDIADLEPAVRLALKQIGQGELAIEVDLVKVSAVGTGMRSHTGVAAAMFQALGEAGIQISNITTSEIKVSCIIPRGHGEEALRLVHDRFGLSTAVTTGVKSESP